jgi:Ca-activated chloride channel family protein
VSFASPLILIALVAIPLLVRWYTSQQRRRAQVAQAFVAPALTPSVAPRRPGWRRHVPMLAFAVAVAALIVAAARPQRSVAVPITNGAVMLANDVSSSMLSTDVSPTRLEAAKRADKRFLASSPSSVEIGLLEFARTPIVLQSPSTDHSLAQAALAQFRVRGGTAIGDAIVTSLHVLATLPTKGGKRPPGAIVLLSDGTSNVGSDPLAAARAAAAQHVPVYTIALGTPNGTIAVRRGSQTVMAPDPPDPRELAQIASISGGRSFTVADSAALRTVYSHLAAQLGRKQVKHELTASLAGGGLVLLLIGSGLSLHWFGRLV